MDEVKNDYIEKALNELVPVLGIKEFIDHEKLFSLIHSKKIKEAIKIIAHYLDLPVEVNLSYVPSGYRPNSNDGFRSTHLVKTTAKNGIHQGTAGITAQISIPPNLPFYRSDQMVNFPINVRVSENCAENAATLIGVMAHELSHIILYSMWHKEKENEFYTDLTAMILGFANIMSIGRKVVKVDVSTDQGFLSNTTTTHTQTTTYGYLSDDNFHFAFNQIKIILNQRKFAQKELLKKLYKFQKQFNKTKASLFLFEKYLKYVDEHLNKKISQEDAIKISIFHQYGYTDNFESSLRRNDKSLETFFNFIKNLKDYSERSAETMKQCETQIKHNEEEVTKQHFLLNKDIGVLKKYVSIFYKIKINLGFIN